MAELDKQDYPDLLPWQNSASWLNSMTSLLAEVSTIEISTVIVDEITEEVFLPYEVYQAIYRISPSYLEESKVHSSLRDRYLQLRRQLELQYALLVTNNDSSLYDEQLAPEIINDLPLLADKNTLWKNLPCRLPPLLDYGSSAANKIFTQLLAEPSFKSILRQLGAIKANLDLRNLEISQSHSKKSSLTYAQTSIQLDGKITNRYASEIIEHPHKSEIISLHQKGIDLGSKQWHKLLGFIAEIIRIKQKFTR